MTEQPGNRVLRAGSGSILLLLCVSLAANVLLAAWLLRPRASLPAFPVQPQQGQQRIRQPLSPGMLKKKSDAAERVPAGTPGTDTAPPFLWSQIESADYREYIANLRAVGCPEQIIHDIIA